LPIGTPRAPRGAAILSLVTAFALGVQALITNFNFNVRCDVPATCVALQTIANLYHLGAAGLVLLLPFFSLTRFALVLTRSPQTSTSTCTATCLLPQIIANLYHLGAAGHRTLLVAHSNAALNDLFEKIMERDIDER
jgi:hypothetical protein